MSQRILFICLGNICRSCTAEEVFRTLAQRKGIGTQYEVDSAGIIDYHEGELPDARMRRHGNAHGYRFDHRARQISKDDLLRFDRIMVMDNENYRTVTSLAPDASCINKVEMLASYLRHHEGQTTIPDPYYGTDRDFELVIELLEDACEGLIDHIMSNH